MGKPKAALIDSEDERYFIFDDTVILGRGPSSEDDVITYVVSIKDSSISRKHCIISRKPDNSYTICDMSARGTFVNGQRLVKTQPTPLQHKDKITLLPSGVYSYVFWINHNSEAPKSEGECDLSLYLTEQILPLENSYCIKVKQIDEELDLIEKKQPIEKDEEKDEKEKELRNKRDSLNQALSHIRQEKLGLEEKLRDLEEKSRLRECLIMQDRILAEVELETKISNLAKEKRDLQERLHQSEMALLEKDKTLKSQEETLVAKAAAEQNLKKEIQGIEEQLQCSICVELFIEPMILNCGHVFCKSCLTQWRKKSKICPMCRAKITQCIRTFHLDSIIEKNSALLSANSKQTREDIIEERATPSKKNGKKRKHNGKQVPRISTPLPDAALPTAVPLVIPSTSTATIPSIGLPVLFPETITSPHTSVVQPPTVSLVEPSSLQQLDPFAFAQHQQRRRQRGTARPETPVQVAAIDLTAFAAPANPNHLSAFAAPANPNHLSAGPSYIDLTTP